MYINNSIFNKNQWLQLIISNSVKQSVCDLLGTNNMNLDSKEL